MLSQIYDKARHQLEDLLEDDKVSSLNRYAGLLIIAVLLIVLALESNSLLSTLNYEPTITQAITPTSSSKPSNYQASSITNSHLFGRSAASQSINPANIPVTRMQLILRGAFTSSNPKQASAIIEGPDGQTRSYKTGSKIYGQASLRQVFNDRVVLSRNGQLETLYFPQPGTSSAGTNNSNDTASTYLNTVPDDITQLVQDNMSADEIQSTAKQLRSSAMTPEQRQQLIRKRLQELRDRSRANK